MGFTVLQIASVTGRADVCQMLLEDFKADAKKATKGLNETSLHLAASSGHADVIKLLGPHALLNAKNVWGGTPLHCAASRGHIEAVEALLTLGACPKAATQKGETALHLARTADIIEFLIERGLDVNALDSNNDSAIHQAVQRGDLRSCMVLLANNASANMVNFDDETPLHIAARMGHDPIIQLLLNAGCDPAIVNMAGMTAADVAVKEGRAKIYSRIKMFDGSSESRVKSGYFGNPSQSAGHRVLPMSKSVHERPAHAIDEGQTSQWASTRSPVLLKAPSVIPESNTAASKARNLRRSITADLRTSVTRMSRSTAAQLPAPLPAFLENVEAGHNRLNEGATTPQHGALPVKIDPAAARAQSGAGQGQGPTAPSVAVWVTGINPSAKSETNAINPRAQSVAVMQTIETKGPKPDPALNEGKSISSPGVTSKGANDARHAFGDAEETAAILSPRSKNKNNVVPLGSDAPLVASHHGRKRSGLLSCFLPC